MPGSWTETVWAAIMNGNKEEAVLGVVYRRPGISEEEDNDLHQTIVVVFSDSDSLY